MKLINLNFKAFKAYKKATQLNAQSSRDRKVIAKANASDDFLTAIKYEAEIESDWVENIEEGLIYIEKAILEDRQFIRVEGNVIEIEKVKKTSKATVEHLARHSNLITRIPKEGDNLIPDKLYMEEKLTDFAVYENRFIYMLLRYLKDFIQIRLDKIRDKVTTYESHMIINKDIRTNNANIQYKLDYDAIYKNDDYLIKRAHDIPLMDRVENTYSLVNAFLATPLMKEVSKAPLIKPPIVKTNVLLMNQNFRAAVALYEFVRSYIKDGYQFKEIINKFNPFNNGLADDFAHVVELTGTVAYTYGQDIENELIKNLEAEEKEEKAKEKAKAEKELNRIKKILNELNEDPTEYIAKMEKYNTDLVRENNALLIENSRITDLEETIQSLTRNNEKLTTNNINLNEEINNHINTNKAFKQKYFDDFKASEKVHFEEIEAIKTLMAETINDLNQKHESYITQLNKINADKLNEQKSFYENELATTINHYDEKIEVINNEIIKLKDKINDLENEKETLINNHQAEIKELEDIINSLNEDIKVLESNKNATNARLYALQEQHGLNDLNEDFTSKAKFKQLETERKAYNEFFKREWSKTKQAIKKRVKKEVEVKESNDLEVRESSDLEEK